MEYILLGAALVVGLVLIPFGLPGLWLMVGAALLYSYARPQQLGTATLIGAVVGVPVPLIGSVIGAFVGAFAGALAAEMTRGAQVRAATRVATGALVGRAVAAAMKVGVGLALIVWVVAAMIWNSRAAGGP